MFIVVDTEEVGTEMGHKMKRATYHIHCHIEVVTEKMATEIGQSKNTESFNVCIVVETERVARFNLGNMKNNPLPYILW